MNEDCKKNPFTLPIVSIWAKIGSISWSFPYLAQIFQFLIQIFILVLLCVLFCTVGILVNCYYILCKLLSDSREEFQGADLIGKSAYALVAGIYLLFIIPLWVVFIPFMTLGRLWDFLCWLWDHWSVWGILFLILLVFFLLAIIVFYMDNISYYWDSFIFPLLGCIM